MSIDPVVLLELMAHGIQNQEQFNELMFRQETQGIAIVQSENELRVPKDMKLSTAIKMLERQMNELESNFNTMETFDAFFFDALWAVKKVIEAEFGCSFTDGETVMTMFGPMKVDARMIKVEASPGVVVDLPFGDIILPGIEGEITTKFGELDGRVVLRLHACVKGKHREALSMFFGKIRDYLKTNSLYKGKAIKLNFRDSDGDRLSPHPDNCPKFIKTSEPVVIFNESTQRQLDVALLNGIKYSDRLRERGIPVGRKILMEGDYGTGKTLTASQTAHTCVTNDWTFIYVTDGRDLGEALKVAEQYSPACVFVEDIDHIFQIEDKGEKNREINALSLCLDGVDNKNREVMLVMTTNKVQDIPTILKRPGRTDAIIHIGRPDEDTVTRLVEHYANGWLANVDSYEIKEAIQPVVGQSASFIRELVERAKLIAVSNDDGQITADDLSTAADMMAHHAAILDGNYEPVQTEKSVF